MIFTSCQERPTQPVGKILCVGRNDADHAREMGVPPPVAPLWFLKPATSLWQVADPIPLPGFSQEIHHEVELVLRVGRNGSHWSEEEAGHAVDACGVGLDLTARDLQRNAKERGEPWTLSKGWDGAAPLSPLLPLQHTDELARVTFTLQRNGRQVQEGAVRRMLFPPARLLAHASQHFRLEAGDLLFTGTPAGVGPVQPGDTLVAELSLGPTLTVRFA